MVVNSAGPVQIFDGGNLQTVTVRASVGVTGGQLIFFSGAANNVSSGTSSYVTNDITIGGAGSGRLFNGMVITPGLTASGTNNYITVAQNGTWIITSAGTINAGNAIWPNGEDAVIGVEDTITGSYTAIGRALTNAGSEGFAVVRLF